MATIDWFADADNISHDGTETQTDGVGFPPIGPGFAGGWDVHGLAAPNGIQTYPSGYFCHGGYFYLLNTSDDKVYRYAIDSAANLTPDSSQTMANMGLAGDRWLYWGNCLYDSSDGSVIICTYQPAVGTYTPVVGKWLCSSWPFTNLNAEWLSPVEVRYGGFTSGKLTNWYYPSLCTATDKLYLCSQFAGQVITLDATDGSVLGSYEPDAAYRMNYQFLLSGFNDSNLPVASQYASVGLGSLSVYDDANPAAWSKGAVVLSSPLGYPMGAPHHGRNQNMGYGDKNRMVSLHDSERALVGLPDMAWWSCNRTGLYGEMYLHAFNCGTSEHSHRSVAQAGDRRAIGNATPAYFSNKFIEIAGQPWFVSYNMHNQDIEDENPGVDLDLCRGLVFTPMGERTATYTINSAPMAGTPKKIIIGVDDAANNCLFSDEWAKSKFEFKVGDGEWSPVRAGSRQCLKLDEVIDSLAALDNFNAGDTLYLRHTMTCGWPVSCAPTLGNPGGVGDPTPVSIHSANVGPPREIRVKMDFEPAERGGGLL